jgi:hypothetical protein
MQYVYAFLCSSSIPFWSKQHSGLHEEVDRECQDCLLTMKILQSKQLLRSELQPFESEKFQTAKKKLFNLSYPNLT